MSDAFLGTYSTMMTAEANSPVLMKLIFFCGGRGGEANNNNEYTIYSIVKVL